MFKGVRVGRRSRIGVRAAWELGVIGGTRRTEGLGSDAGAEADPSGRVRG